MNISEQLESVTETANRTGWSENRVRRLIKEGLPTIKIDRQHLINPETLDDFLLARESSKDIAA